MDYRRTYIKNVLQLHPGTKTTVFGWVKTLRISKSVNFIQINDGSCFKDLQIVLPSDHFPDEKIKSISTGTSIRIDGELVASPAQGQSVELLANHLEIYGPADSQTYPLQKKGASFEFLREIAHLRTRSNTFGAVFRVRSKAAQATYQFFEKRGFHLIHTPVITTGDCEGAGQQFTVSTSIENQDDKYKLKSILPQDDFFQRQAFLTVSGQLEAETLAHGMTNVYTFGPTFRAENSHSARHLAEFWMLEPEMAFCGLEGDIKLAQEYLKEVTQYLLEHCQEDLAFFNQRIEPTLIETLEQVVHSTFEQITYTQAIEMLEKSSQQFEFPVYWGCDLQSEHERWLTEHKIGRPVTITDFPKDIKAFYMRLNDDHRTVAAMDILVPRIGEIIGGSQREERLNALEQRLDEMKLSKDSYWWYLDMRRYGSVPHAGFGLGFERLLMYVTGMKNIRDVIPYYRTPGSAEF